MRTQAGTQGQIALGARYAGQVFEVREHQGGVLELRPVEANADALGQTDQAWAHQHQADIDRYNTWALERQPYSQRVRRWRETGA